MRSRAFCSDCARSGVTVWSSSAANEQQASRRGLPVEPCTSFLKAPRSLGFVAPRNTRACESGATWLTNPFEPAVRRPWRPAQRIAEFSVRGRYRHMVESWSGDNRQVQEVAWGRGDQIEESVLGEVVSRGAVTPAFFGTLPRTLPLLIPVNLCKMMQTWRTERARPSGRNPQPEKAFGTSSP